MQVYKSIQKVMEILSTVGISKQKENQQQHYKFRGIDDVLNTLSSALVSSGLIIVPRVMSREVVERLTKTGGTLFYVTVHVEFDFISAQDGSKHTVSTYGEAMDSADKATNKAMSAAYKYMALLTFCIPTEAMPDADAETHQLKEEVKQLPTLTDDKFKDALAAIQEGKYTFEKLQKNFKLSIEQTNEIIKLTGEK